MQHKTLPVNIAAAAAIAISLASPLAHSATFQHEVAGQVEKASSDDAEMSAVIAGYRYHFQPVSQQQGPWAAASFLDPSSNLALIGYKASTNYNSDYSLGRYKADSLSVSGEWYLLPQQTSINALFSQSRDDHQYDDLPVDAESATNYSSLGIHHYLNQTTQLTLDYSLSRSRLEMDGSGIYSSISGTNHYNTQTWSLSLKHLYLLDSGRAFGAQASFARRRDYGSDGNDAETEWSLAASYFPNQRLGLTLNHEHSNSADSGYSNELGVSWFATRKLELEAGVNSYSEGDLRVWSIGASYQY